MKVLFLGFIFLITTDYIRITTSFVVVGTKQPGANRLFPPARHEQQQRITTISAGDRKNGIPYRKWTKQLRARSRRRPSITPSAASISIEEGDDGGGGVVGGTTELSSQQQQSAAATTNTNNINPQKAIQYGGATSKSMDSSLEVSRWPRFDALDKKLTAIAIPCILNYAINPLIGAVDLFWVNRMGDPLAVAGQAAANQMFSTAFWLASFLPSVTATLVSKEYAKGDEQGVQDSVCQALFIGVVIACIGTPLMLMYPEKVLSMVLSDGAPAMEFAKPYLLIRAFAFLPAFMTVIGFSAFRGILDPGTPVRISFFANLFNAILDPILIFKFKLGVPGAAMATLAAELISAATYLTILRKRNIIRLRRILRLPSWDKLKPLLTGGAALQLRNFALNFVFLAVTRVTQSIDSTGVAAAAHALSIQTFQIGGIVLLGLSTVAQTVVPNEMVERTDPKTGKRIGGRLAAKMVVQRLMSWGFLLGTLLGSLQILVLPLLHQSTPLEEVRKSARIPSYLASLYQIINGLVFIGEGVMVGCENFFQLSISTLMATFGFLWCLRSLPTKFGLTGVWIGFGVFNTLRLVGVWVHQARNGPLAPRNIMKKNNDNDGGKKQKDKKKEKQK
eukprot:CAMPEP_0194049432 /NCGR_PEP_ID=MMETSP0009_2-20130614/30671_1 /TAXON_ID=210454 /ORGANISM="Grammatophora oceanica, Strain CCMP 410" /LENGTH=618 /DNA_ID=CAMNT_0038695593 /DNA_START=396 /DNA_END=2252 /DNA_ORIENTATION=-